MRSLTVFVVILCALMLAACSKSDSGNTRQENQSSLPAVQPDSIQADSAMSALQKKVDDVRTDAEDLQKTVDDLLK